MNSFEVDLRGHRAVISGAAAGLGLTIAVTLRRFGASVYCCDVDPKAAQAARVQHGLDCMEVDIADPNRVDAFVAHAAAAMGGIDVVVNNAAIAGPSAQVDAIGVDDWQRVLDVNVTGSFLLCRAVVPELRKSGRGSIVNISSAAIARGGYPQRLPYAMSKAALHQLTETLAMDLGRFGINVNTVLPGTIDNPRARRVVQAIAARRQESPEVTWQAMISANSLRTAVTETDVALLVAFLVSNAGSRISAQAIAVCANFEGHRSSDS
jgi:NAD(P)-dependent dehydrogenase (short-subunit alcohol dehydrogenase family)